MQCYPLRCLVSGARFFFLSRASVRPRPCSGENIDRLLSEKDAEIDLLQQQARANALLTDGHHHPNALPRPSAILALCTRSDPTRHLSSPRESPYSPQMGDLELQNSRLRASVAAMRSEMEELHALLADAVGNAELPGSTRSPAGGARAGYGGVKGGGGGAGASVPATPREQGVGDGSPLPSPPSWRVAAALRLRIVSLKSAKHTLPCHLMCVPSVRVCVISDHGHSCARMPSAAPQDNGITVGLRRSYRPGPRPAEARARAQWWAAVDIDCSSAQAPAAAHASALRTPPGVVLVAAATPPTAAGALSGDQRRGGRRCRG